MTTMYGIANCDTIKKAKRWLEGNNIDYVFHDYKKQGVDPDIVQQAIKEFGVDVVVNKRGTTYRKLSDDVKASITAANATNILTEHPSMIKRPILLHEGKLLIGFKEDNYSEVFAVG